MKTKILGMAVILGMLSQSLNASVPNSSFKMSSYLTKDAKIKMSVIKEKNTEVRVQIIDAQGHIAFDKYLPKKEESIGIKLDLSYLESGNYTLVCKSKKETISKTINISNSTVVTEKNIIFI